MGIVRYQIFFQSKYDNGQSLFNKYDQKQLLINCSIDDQFIATIINPEPTIFHTNFTENSFVNICTFYILTYNFCYHSSYNSIWTP